jgi:cbb3-type cytochrome oxidase maturation protein
MDILYLLIPISALLLLGIVAIFGWALQGGQFDELEAEGSRLLAHDDAAFDRDQTAVVSAREKSVSTISVGVAGGPE